MLRMKLITFSVLVLWWAATGFADPQSQIHDTAAVAKWHALAPAINTALTRQAPDLCDAGHSNIEIVDAAELHAPGGLSVALVDWCQAGAYMDQIVVMQLEDGRPVLSIFKNAHDKVEPDMIFGQGASVMHGADVKLAPEKNAIYDIRWDNDQKLHLTCAADAYVWNEKAKDFSLDTELSKRVTRTECAKVQQVVAPTR